MAGAIGLSGIHNVTGICDLCGVKCDPNNEELNALDCTYKECPSMVYHQDCLEKYLKSIRLEKNRKTGFKCPRGCGKGTRYPESCRGKIDKSHPIHVRHEQITKSTKNEKATSKKKSAEEKAKKKENIKTPTLANLNLVKALPSKDEERNSEWRVSLTRSKSLDKTISSARQSSLSNSSKSLGGTASRCKSRKSTGSISFTCSRKGQQVKISGGEGLGGDLGTKDSCESVKSQSDSRPGDLDNISDNGSQKHSVMSCESPDVASNSQSMNLPSLQEESMRQMTSKEGKGKLRGNVYEKCKKCLIEWKSTMLIKQLYRMGFPMWKANSAVQIFGSNIEEAIQWLLQHGDMTHDQVNLILQHHCTTAAQINIDFELKTILHFCQKHSIEESILEEAVVRFEGDLNAAIQSFLGNKLDEHSFPDCDLSLGIVHSESPFLCDISLEKSATETEPEVHTDVLSDELMLGCVLGSRLEDYKRGNVDFTDLVVNKDFGVCDSFGMMPSTGGTNSPLSPSVVHSPSSNQVSSYFVQHPMYPASYGQDLFFVDQASGYHNPNLASYDYVTSTSFVGNGNGTTSMVPTNPMELRHFIGDILE